MSYSDEHWTATCLTCGEELEKQTIQSLKNELPYVCGECNTDIAENEVKWVHND